MTSVIITDINLNFKIMKKLLLLVVAFLFLGLGAQAQSTMSKGQLVGSARLGLGGGGFPIAVSADYGVVDHLINKNDAISVGGQVGIFMYDSNISFINIDYKILGLVREEILDNIVCRSI